MSTTAKHRILNGGDIIRILQWLVRCMYLLLRHIAQTRPGVVDPLMLDEGEIHYAILRLDPDADQELEIK